MVKIPENCVGPPSLIGNACEDVSVCHKNCIKVRPPLVHHCLRNCLLLLVQFLDNGNVIVHNYLLLILLDNGNRDGLSDRTL